MVSDFFRHTCWEEPRERECEKGLAYLEKRAFRNEGGVWVGGGGESEKQRQIIMRGGEEWLGRERAVRK